LVTLPKNFWTIRVLGSVVIQLYAGATPSVDDRALTDQRADHGVEGEMVAL